jgi:hypothetical protein
MLLVGAAPAVFAASGFLRPVAGDRLESGTVVELLWNLDGVSPDAQESELVLSLDGGLALRAGNDEEPAQETLLLVSPAFVISGSRPDATLEELFAVGSEWRTREALEIDPGRSRDTGLHGVSSQQIHAGPDRDVTAHAGERSALLPECLPAAAAAAEPRTPQRPSDPHFGQRPFPTPLRE